MIVLNKTYTYDELMHCVLDLQCRFPDILKLTIVGTSHDERNIPMIQMGTSEKCLICSAGVHGRESINPILLLKIIEDYCLDYEKGNDSEGKEFIQKNSICFLPLINPDGYEIALEGYRAIRNPIYRHAILMDGVDAREWKCNGRGVDINRNFPSHSFVSRGRMGCSASENETKALIQVFKEFPNSIGYIDFHSRGQIIYYYRNSMSDSYNQEGRHMAMHFQHISQYQLGTEEDEFEDSSSGGNSVNYYSEHYKRLAITVETLPDEAEFPLDKAYQEGVYSEISQIPMTYLKECKK